MAWMQVNPLPHFPLPIPPPLPEKHLAEGISGVTSLCSPVKLENGSESVSWFSQMLWCSLGTGSFQLSFQALDRSLPA